MAQLAGTDVDGLDLPGMTDALYQEHRKSASVNRSAQNTRYSLQDGALVVPWILSACPFQGGCLSDAGSPSGSLPYYTARVDSFLESQLPMHQALLRQGSANTPTLLQARGAQHAELALASQRMWRQTLRRMAESSCRGCRPTFPRAGTREERTSRSGAGACHRLDTDVGTDHRLAVPAPSASLRPHPAGACRA